MQTYKRSGVVLSVFLDKSRIEYLERFLSGLCETPEGATDLSVSVDFEDTSISQDSLAEVLNMVSDEDSTNPSNLTLVAQAWTTHKSSYSKRIQIGFSWLGIYYVIEGRDKNWTFGAEARVKRQLRSYQSWRLRLPWVTLVLCAGLSGAAIGWFSSAGTLPYATTLDVILPGVVLIGCCYIAGLSPYGLRATRPKRLILSESRRLSFDSASALTLVAAVITLIATLLGLFGG